MKKREEPKVSWAVAIAEKLEKQKRFLKRSLKPIEIKRYTISRI